MSESMIGAHPPGDGREWDNQCARCGSSMDWVYCEECDGIGVIEDDDDEFGDERAERICSCCHSYGGYYACLSSAKFCQENPLPGRQETKRGQIEWWTLEEARQVVSDE